MAFTMGTVKIMDDEEEKKKNSSSSVSLPKYNNSGFTMGTIKQLEQEKPKKESSKKSGGYHFGDFTKAFWGSAKEGWNDFWGIPGKVVDGTKKVINESEAMKDGYDFGDITKTLGSTALSGIQNFGEGAIRAGEQAVDAGANLFGGASDWVNTKVEKMFGMHKGESEKDVNAKKAQARKEMIATNYTDELMKWAGKDDEYKDLVESNSLIKTDNMGGAIAQELGRQSVNLLINNKIGSNNKMVQSIPLLTSAYGSGVEEAYKNGASWDEANRYGLLNAATETVTEWVTGGIPGMKGTAGGGLDKIAGKIIGEPIEESSKSFAKAILKSGYKLAGEGTEEALADFINPYLKQFTYEYNSNKDALGNFKEAFDKSISGDNIQTMMQSFIMGAITAGILDSPSNVLDIAGTINNKNNISNSSNVETSLQESQNQVNSNENMQNNINIPEIEYTSQNGLKLPINNIQNSNLNLEENSKSFIEKQQEIKNNKLQEENNNKINELEQKLSKIQGLENYSEEEIKNNIDRYIKQKLEENGIDPRDIEIVDSNIHGSRKRGNAKADSDLDVVVQYNGDLREDDLFNILNNNGDDNLYFDDIRVDINPIKENLNDYMNRSKQYDEQLLNKRPSLSEQLEKQGSRILEESESQKQAMIEHFKEYLEENNIANPTQQDINNSIIDNLIYDNELDATDTARAEQLYNQYVKEYMQENNIPFNNNQIVVPRELDIKTLKSDLSKKELKNINDSLKISDDFVREINYKTTKNMEKNKNINYVSTDELSNLYSNGGYRTTEQFTSLINKIKSEGIKEPIEISIDQYGNRKIEDGQHRLYIANKLGLKQIPVIETKITNLENIDANDKSWYNKSKGDNYEGKVNSVDEASRDGQKYDRRSDGPTKNGRTNEEDNGLHRGVPRYNNKSSAKTISDKINIQELDNSSFNYAPKSPATTETRKIDSEIKKEQPVKEVNKKKVENNENAIKRLTQEKAALTERLTNKIEEKQELLKNKKNKDSKLATQLNIQISNLNNQLQNRQLDYDNRIEYYKNKNEKMNSEEYKIQEQRISKKQEYIDQAYDLTENMVDWKDKSKGISYQINTMKRNLFDIMPKSDADKVYNTYFQPITENNAKSEKFINSYNDRIKKLNLNNKESQAVQMLGEYKYNKDTLVTGPQVDEFISKNHLNYDKLANAVEEFRTIYDELITETNKILKEQGYKEIEYRKGYFPHFQEETKPGKFAKLAEKLGFKVNKNDALPTDIAGMTEIFKPGKTYFKNAQRRLGKYTDYNALKGYDNYIRGAADLIFHTEDIQKLRALETVIRTQYTDNSIKETIQKISSNPDYDMDQKQALIDLEFLKINNPLPNFVTELRNYTDSLANKKDIGDRGMEHMLGRETYTIMKNVQSRVSANMVGFNISSALTNFIPITQAWGEISTKNMAKAIKQSIANQFKNDGFADASTYLINRTQQADRLYKTGVDKVNSKAGAIFEAVDEITSNVIVRGKYLDNIDKGMTEAAAMKNANEFAKDIMAGRSKGDSPTIFNRKNPLVKLFTAFQLEVNNQYGYMLKDLPRNLSDEAKKKLAMAFIKMFVGAWLYNKFSETVTGRKSAFSPIDIVGDSIETINNDNILGYDKISNISQDLAKEIPFVGGFLGGGRLPIQSAIPDIGTTVQSITELGDDEKRGKAINNLTKELEKPLFYVALPFGGGQLKKTIEGASMYTHETPGSYTAANKLRFEAPKSPIGVAQSLIFGQYSSKQAREYFDNGYTPLSEKQIEDWKETGVSLPEYRKYRQEYSKLSKIKGDKDENDKTIKGTATGKKAYNIMNNDNISTKEKDYLLKTISSSDKYVVTSKDLSKIANDEDVYKYFYSLSAENKEKFINDIDTKGFSSRQLYDYYSTKKEYDKKYTSGRSKELIIDYLTNSDLTDNQKYYLYSKEYSSDDTVNLLKQFNVGANNYFNTMKYINDVKFDYQGDNYKNYRRQLIQNYIQGLNASVLEKAVLYKQAGYSISNYKNAIYSYIDNLPLSAVEKKKLWYQVY